jgi:hypothetical protein
MPLFVLSPSHLSGTDTLYQASSGHNPLIKEQSSDIMDSIITSSDPEVQGRLFEIIQEFLTSEAEKHSAAQKGDAN